MKTISVRIDDTTAVKLQDIKKILNLKSTSFVLREAISDFHGSLSKALPVNEEPKQ